MGAIVFLHVIHREALEAAYVHGIVHHAAAAVHLAGVLAHVTADQRQWVVLADEAYGVGVAAGLHQADVAGDVHAGWAAGDAGHQLGLLEAAGVVMDMTLEIIPEALHCRKRHGAGLVADGAVGRKVDVARCPLDKLQGLRGCAVLQHVVKKIVERIEPHAAGGALAAALGGTHGDIGCRELHWARRQRAHRQAPFQGLVQAVHDRLRSASLHHMQTRHTSPSSSFLALGSPQRARHSAGWPAL